MLALLGLSICCVIYTWLSRGWLWALMLVVCLPACFVFFLAVMASIFGYLARP